MPIFGGKSWLFQRKSWIFPRNLTQTHRNVTLGFLGFFIGPTRVFYFFKVATLTSTILCSRIRPMKTDQAVQDFV